MAPLELTGNTLGEKHQHYNKLVEDALKNNEDLKPFDQSSDEDIQNLIKIDIACKTRNVNYILEVLKSENDLYVSKAIKRSTWLITDPQYAHIINPEYLYTVLYPQVTLKAFNKLMLSVRLHLKDEKRVEAFYDHIKEKDMKTAHKWLQNCSIPFIAEVAKNAHKDALYSIDWKILRRLFKKSFSIYELLKLGSHYYYFSSQDCEQVFNFHPEMILDFLEKNKDDSFFFRLGPKATKTVMKKYQERIINNFGLYGKYLHSATLAKYLNNCVDVKELLLKHADNIKLRHLYKNDRLQHFIKKMPKETRFEFVKKLFIDKDEDTIYKVILERIREQPRTRKQIQNHSWYKFAPFETAHEELDKLIRAESIPLLRSSMLQVLLTSAGSNIYHIRTVLQYYHDKHFNEAFKFKNQFVNFFLSNVYTCTLDDSSWNLLCKLFHSMEVFIESENNVQSCVNAIVIRNVLRNEPVPDIIERKLVLESLSPNKLKTQEEKETVFNYLNNYLVKRSNALNLAVESNFQEAVTLCERQLRLIKNWNKQLQDYPHALAKVKELIKIKNETCWSRDYNFLYTINKNWRKIIFQDSFVPVENEAVYMNLLKHNPGLLSSHKENILATCLVNNVSLKNILYKIRIYWPQTLAEDFKIIYLDNLSDPDVHKAAFDGLCILLSNEQIIKIMRKHAPSETKITWNEIDQNELSLCKNLAKNVYKTRPLLPFEEVLHYTKGDYLQYIVPSINAILSQLSPNKSLTYIPVLLEAPLSLKKFGLRSAIHKLSSEQLKPILSKIWNSSKNKSIRTVIFTHLFNVLCNGKHASQVIDTWSVLNMFIDKITQNDSKSIFENLGQFYKVPICVQPYFFLKSFAIISSLPAKCNCRQIYDRMLYSAIDYVEYYDNEFVIKYLLNNFNGLFDKKRETYDKLENVLSCYILSSMDEDIQLQRYDGTLDVILLECLPQWRNNKICKDWIQAVLENLISDLETYTFDKKMAIPLKIFEKILDRLENALSVNKYYEFLIMWKFATAFVKVLHENEHILADYEESTESNENDEKKASMFEAVHKYTAPLFANNCVQYLKEDIQKFGHSIYLLMARGFRKLLFTHLPGTKYTTRQSLLYQKSLLQCGNEPELYLMVYQIIVKDLSYHYDMNGEDKKICKEINDLVMLHCSDEIKILFNYAFKCIPLSEL